MPRPIAIRDRFDFMTSENSPAPIEREEFTWDDFGRAARELAQMIADSKWMPEVVIAVARGGLIPAGAISYALGTKICGSLNVEFYSDVAETLPEPIVLPPLLDTDSLRGRKVLVADDVADSGKTLELTVAILEDTGADVRTATIYAKPSTVFEPDYVLRHTAKWITFPWSAQKPVTGVYGE